MNLKSENDRIAVSGRFFRGLPSGVVTLGFVSMFMDISSELIHSFLPVLMTSVLGAGVLIVGIIEGVSEAAASFMKVFSGSLSDSLRKRKPLVLLGYGLSALTKPFFPLAETVAWVFSARFVDRIGKGIRGAPRDALIADGTPPELRGTAYGLRQALDSVGAFLGPLLAFFLMMLFSGNIRSVMWVSVVPAVLSVILLLAGVRESPGEGGKGKRHALFGAPLAQLPGRYWLIVLLGLLFTLARFSEAFLLLRALDTGLSAAYTPLLMVGMNVVYAGTSYPAGILSDRFGSRAQLAAGLALLVAAHVVLAAAQHPFTVFAGVLLWGGHMGFTQGVLSKLVANHVQERFRGTAFGVFNLATGLAVLLASLIAGALWEAAGPKATFLAGAVFAGVAAVCLFLSRFQEMHESP
jgi:MFS family permease